MTVSFLWDIAETIAGSRARQATSGCMVLHMRNACWIIKATDAHPDCIILLFDANIG